MPMSQREKRKRVKRKRKNDDKKGAEGGLRAFFKGDLRKPLKDDEKKGGLRALMKGDLRKTLDKDIRTGGLRDWFSGNLKLTLWSREVVDDEILELDKQIESAEKLPAQFTKEFIKDAYALREKLKTMAVDTNDIVAQANLNDEVDDFKIGHTLLREQLTGEKDEIEVLGGLSDFKNDRLDGTVYFEQKIHDVKKADMDKEIDMLNQHIDDAVQLKEEYAHPFLENAYALREKIKKAVDKGEFGKTDPDKMDEEARVDLFSDIQQFKETFSQIIRASELPDQEEDNADEDP